MRKAEQAHPGTTHQSIHVIEDFEFVKRAGQANQVPKRFPGMIEARVAVEKLDFEGCAKNFSVSPLVESRQ